MIDLHMHSIYSDGTDDLDSLINKWIENNVEYVAISDHDTINGVKALLDNNELLEKLNKHRIKFIPAIEFASVIDGFKLHLLGYNMDINHENFIELLNTGVKKRLNKFEARIIALKNKYNVEFKEESLNLLRTQKYFLGKPIMVEYMLRDGLCLNRQHGFNMLSNLTNPDYTRVSAREVIDGVRKSNGFCVWAHPLGGVDEPRNSYEKVEEILQKLIPLGLTGLECYYSLYTAEEISQLLLLAKKYNLKVSAGSDYHGKNKKVSIGELSSDTNYNLTKNDVTVLSLC